MCAHARDNTRPCVHRLLWCCMTTRLFRAEMVQSTSPRAGAASIWPATTTPNPVTDQRIEEHPNCRAVVGVRHHPVPLKLLLFTTAHAAAMEPGLLLLPNEPCEIFQGSLIMGMCCHKTEIARQVNSDKSSLPNFQTSPVRNFSIHSPRGRGLQLQLHGAPHIRRVWCRKR